MSLDPTQTTGLARRFEAAIRTRFRALARAVRELLVEDDALGLASGGASVIATHAVPRGVWRFHASHDKVAAFDSWLKDWAAKHVLEEADGGEPWVTPYVRAAYAKGLGSAYTDAASKKIRGLPQFLGGARAEFLRSTLSNVKTRASVRLLATRAFEDLKGITATAGTRMNKILATGLLQGEHPSVIAKQMTDAIDGVSHHRATMIARTEVIHAHAEGALDAFEALGVEDLGVDVEWLATDDDTTCDACSDLEGKVFKIDEARGILPRHPGCRCSWIPSVVAKQRDHARELVRATADSLESETGSPKGERSAWAGKVLERKLRAKLKRRESDA